MKHFDLLLKTQFLQGGKPVEAAQILEARELALKEVPSVSLEGRPVCLQEPDGLTFCVKYMLLLDLGAVPVLIPQETHAFQLERIASTQGAHVWQGTRWTSAKEPGLLKFGAAAYGCLTSGTTGDPKISFHSVEGARKNARAHAESLGFTTGTLVQALPLTHAFGIVCYLWAAIELDLQLHLLQTFLTPASWNKLVSEDSLVYLSPALGRLLLQRKLPLIPPRSLSVGGGLFHRDEFFRLKAQFTRSDLFVTYGFTEAGPRVSTARIQPDFQERSLGSALPGVKLKVLVEDQLLPHGRGRLCVRTPSAKLNLKPNEHIGEFLLSSDEVILHEDGRIEYVDRVDDLIKVGGVSVYPSDIVSALRRFFPRLESLVLKEQHSVYGEVPILVIEGEQAPEEIRQRLAESLSPVQQPRRYVALREFPRNRFGKVDRKAVRGLVS